MSSIELIVQNELCTGCGVCISEDGSKQAKMVWNENGFLVPQLGVDSTQEQMVKVCPFSIQQQNEDELSDIFIKNTTNKYGREIGYYNSLYAGYSQQFRENSSSGGIATFVFQTLLELKIVDQLFVVKEVNGKYGYHFFSDAKEIAQISKTRYTPVTLEKLFQKISEVEGTVAVSGVACFVKAIRLKQLHNPLLKEKIPFVVGIVCGGLKSKHYTDFLAQESGCHGEYTHAQYRIKNENSYALNYKFSCTKKENNRIHTVEMSSLGDMWGTGLFKSNACDFCDDVLTELADISLGDAWIDPYDKSGLGNSIIITRSDLANEIIQMGIIKNKLNLDILDIKEIIQSQSGSFNHRHKGLSFRLKFAKKNGMMVPIKRNKNINEQNFIFNLVQVARLDTRKKSLEIWRKTKNLNQFNTDMKPYLEKLKFLTKWNHRFLRINKLLKNMMVRK